MRGVDYARLRCARKIPHPSEAAALQAIEEMPRDRDWHRLEAYPCGGHWHVGRRPVRVDKRVYTRGK